MRCAIFPPLILSSLAWLRNFFACFDVRDILRSSERYLILILARGIIGTHCSGLLSLTTRAEVIYSPQNKTGVPVKRRNFSAEFKRESAQLIPDQNHTVAAAASAMDVGLSAMRR